ncbi:argininosuccinate lyase [Maridesulfovibrio hydrothermalis]|uniref:Argininosuccinate lyase n=1 Tax=Maridesulfovibrio hydrothermalis AM13 = DSM 14728 TaxID=1121451 RepID=L0REN9_9BACT|nr:argininosuccinate lyase [Maridesulfovibrio hydrothermalis]CCO24677.1 argininosuccinate lyase [Maridesulfovibrio hydrothermalis AM13 = DSM 14728]
MADNKLWGGRFAQKTAASVEDYTESVSYDQNLYREDIAGSQAHARMLAEQGVLTSEEAETLSRGLDQVLEEIESGKFEWKKEMEDLHMNIESRLTEIVGAVGGKLHTGRSRNDQVATAFRLHVVRSLEAWKVALEKLVAVFTAKAEANTDVLLPGYTHLQPAQPVSLAHHMLAYAWMFKRDHSRVCDCIKRANVCPLGAAALAGTTYPLNPAFSAQQLGMEGTFRNSLDAVSDRDFVMESLFTGSLIMTHLSRICEELIIWANPCFGFIKLPDAFSTGSSIMPQKKNPDVCELMRGKTGRVFGDLISLLTTVKGLPLAYNRDMQEDKEPFFDADKTVHASVSIMADMMEAMGFNADNMEKALKKGFLNATELADYLVGKGIPFREAHHITGAAVAHAEKTAKGLEDMSLEELKSFSDKIDEDVFEVLSYEAAVKRRVSPGGTGPESVKAQIAELREWLA